MGIAGGWKEGKVGERRKGMKEKYEDNEGKADEREDKDLGKK